MMLTGPTLKIGYVPVQLSPSAAFWSVSISFNACTLSLQFSSSRPTVFANRRFGSTRAWSRWRDLTEIGVGPEEGCDEDCYIEEEEGGDEDDDEEEEEDITHQHDSRTCSRRHWWVISISSWISQLASNTRPNFATNGCSMLWNEKAGVPAICEGMYGEGEADELDNDSICVNVGEINKQYNVLSCKSRWSQHMRLSFLASRSHHFGDCAFDFHQPHNYYHVQRDAKRD